MIKEFLKGQLLSLLLATLSALAVPTASEPSLDACGSLDAKQGVNLTYADVANCYKSIPFDSKLAASTMETVLTFVNDHYSFRDYALTPNLKSPFSSPPVDIMKQLQLVRADKYSNDFSFHTALSTTFNKLYDAHAGYDVECYRAYQFTQDLILYAPVDNGKQSIRIFKDLLNRGYEDCDVKKINGQDAFAYLSNWSSSLCDSKDAGARLNEALASQRLEGWGENEGFVTKAGTFAERSTLPEAPYIDYEIQCGSNSKAVALRENWKVTVAVDGNNKSSNRFKSAQEYVTNVCLRKSGVEYKLSQASDDVGSAGLSSLPTQPRRAEDAHPQLQGAELIMSHKTSVFFCLKAYPKIGVIVIPTHSNSGRHPQPPFDQLVEGLIEFNKRNITHILIDVQGNSGGEVSYAYWLVRAFFPNKDGFDISLLSDVRSPKIVQELAAASFGKQGEFDSSRYIDLKTRKPYNDSDMFRHPIQKTVNGHTDTYSQMAIPVPPPTKDYKELETFPWTNNPANIHILSDGHCGSACGLSTHMFSAYKNVSVTAVGGFKDRPLSMFSFIGGVVQDLDMTLETYEGFKVKTTMNKLPYSAWLRLPITLKYAQNSSIPLEYDPALTQANRRLDFDPKNARDRVAMWIQVAIKAWNL
ncbi:hypothetical protein BGZ72_000593 [Mortierella alpina]|nr:hypothetical protein BGZ72_000593 [Mortierella alpina]